jgi:uncharacterized membrane protein YtjA (UPF0391 family)
MASCLLHRFFDAIRSRRPSGTARERGDESPTSGAVAEESNRRFVMLSWALVFLVLALVAAVFGFGGVAAGAAGIAKILFFLFLIVFVVSLIMNFTRRAV